MIVERIELNDFRNISAASLSFSPTFNYISGRNAQGKTNLLEAVHLFSLGRSFRTRRTQDMVRFAAEGFTARLRGRSDAGVSFRVEVAVERSGRVSVSANGNRLGGMGEIVGLLPSVLFTPSDIELAAGPPAARRLYLDYTAALISPEYLARLREYRSALRQRNALLREAAAGGRLDAGQLDAWDAALSAAGAALTAGRIDILAVLEREAARIGRAILPGEYDLELRYVSSCGEGDGDRGETIRESLLACREAEARRGYTLSGPHCDDVRIRSQGHDLRRYGSQGRLRLTAIVLRMAQAAAILHRRGERPIVLLDDLFSELDARTADGVRGTLTDRYQSFVTTPRPEDVPGDLGGGAWFRVENGGIVAQTHRTSL